MTRTTRRSVPVTAFSRSWSRTRPGCSPASQAFSRGAGYNIFSLAVAPTDNERFSRISIVVDVDSAPLEQVVAQLDKLINVVEIGELHPDEAREPSSCSSAWPPTPVSGHRLIQLVGVFAGRIVDVGHEAITVMVAGTPELLARFESPDEAVRDRRAAKEWPGTALPKLDRGSAAGGAAVTGVPYRFSTVPERPRDAPQTPTQQHPISYKDKKVMAKLYYETTQTHLWCVHARWR